ncbi:MAG: ATP-dependent Clp protease proteolytic subunit [Actinomycetota bacterium]|nr:ATP-dependent Clp protease proteolytic subunit [Actinomycetota bacterium]
MDVFTLFFWIIFIFLFLGPTFRKKVLEARRIQAIRSLEKKRDSRVVTLIHRQEALGLLGIPFFRYIDIEDSEKILRAIRLTPDDMPIDIILHTPGGLVLASEQIAHAIRKHKAKVTVFVPHYAMSGGALIALAADEIVMDEDAVLGSLDPQLGWEYPASSLIWACQVKDRDKLDDRTLVLLDVAEKAVRQLRQLIFDILKDKVDEEKARDLARVLTDGRWTHDYPLTVEKLKTLGIEMKVELPREVYELMELYPQAGIRRPSVEFIPVPYKEKEAKK